MNNNWTYLHSLINVWPCMVSAQEYMFMISFAAKFCWSRYGRELEAINDTETEYGCYSNSALSSEFSNVTYI